MDMSTPWQRETVRESGNIRRWWRQGRQTVHVRDVHDQPYYKVHFLVVEDGTCVGGFLSLCNVADYLADEYAIVPEGSLWQHQVTGNLFVVEHNNPANTHAERPAHPPNADEPWVYCNAYDYDDHEYVWLGRRLFDNDKQLVVKDWLI